MRSRRGAHVPSNFFCDLQSKDPTVREMLPCVAAEGLPISVPKRYLALCPATKVAIGRTTLIDVGSQGVSHTGSLLGTFNHANFSDRIKASTTAKLALVEKLKTRPGPDDPRRAAIAAERKAIHDARLARQEEKQKALQEQRERDAEERRKREEEELLAAIAREAELEAERKAAEAAKLERASRVLNDLAAQKARRDERYAARKSRQKR